MKKLIIILFLFIYSFVYSQDYKEKKKPDYIATIYFTWGNEQMTCRVKYFLIKERGRVVFIDNRNNNVVTISGDYIIIEPPQEVAENKKKTNKNE